MASLFHIKNIWDKISFHPFFYFIVAISLLTGHFKNILYFTTILLVHELGHSLTALFFKIKLKKIEIYPYGGCSKLEYDININLFKELLIIIMGPIIQIIFTYIVTKINVVDNTFLSYSRFILLFNLFPIYPLDGGKLFNIILSFFISFYNSLKITYYFSYFFFVTLFLINIIYSKELFYYLIIISLAIELYKEIKKRNIYFNKFLLERYINNYNFKKIKRITSINEMKRDYLHIINNLFEKEYLAKYFKY